ncbi:6-phosphogluconolactonase [Flagellimonas halotolerans]|uniref:6-phosphogluconolactonase n=1 Tax=Flagellimonas halotolerans TaxID=3112164 RepID=A0ABU6IMK7_9FLAO|nr:MULTISPECIES: 6-phosphogluconolactonase [unclassified Allomuricauda]MEC3964476.1 6-phosphogluconolactonase [Muricauda sp. SYSU M86414]MEC4264345.1 6-phosphogluconolactonase [Muricauda sp. SYSU M84420]
MDLKIYKDKQEVAEQFSSYFADKQKDKDAFYVALSGGSTPKIVFDVLVEKFSDKVDWSKVHFYWGDERCVSPTDDESNYKMTVEHLFSKIKVPKENINRILGEKSPEGEALRYANLLEMDLDRVEEVPQFDLVILGMGDDGHTASIFPHEIELWDSEDHCVVATHPDSGQKRVSINGKVINTAKEVAFLVTGASKAEKVKAVVEKTEGSEAYPASLVNPALGNLLWFLDEAAAARLNQNPS